MNTKIKNAVIFKTDDDFTVLTHKEVGIINGKIAYISDCIPSDIVFDRVIDFDGDILMPAFVNGHTHSAMTLFRSVADDYALEEWLFDNIIPMENHLTANDVYYGTLLAGLEYLQSGIGTICDMYYHPQAICDACGVTGQRLVISGGTVADDDEKKTHELEANFLKFNSCGEKVKYMLGVHAEYTSSQKFLENVADLSYKYNAPTYIHLSETLKEVGDCTIRHDGLTPPLYLHKLGFFDKGGAVAHATHVDKDDIAVLAQSGVSVITNPASNLKLASGIAPVYSMQAGAINVAIGTDGASSNNSLDMFREMYLLSNLQKCVMRDASIMPAHNVLQCATVNGARALGYSDLGRVEVGYKADLIRISTKQPHFMPHNNLVKNAVYSANKSDVLMTMIGGEIFYENGKFNIGIEVNEIYAKCSESIKRLIKAVNK